MGEVYLEFIREPRSQHTELYIDITIAVIAFAIIAVEVEVIVAKIDIQVLSPDDPVLVDAPLSTTADGPAPVRIVLTGPLGVPTTVDFGVNL